MRNKLTIPRLNIFPLIQQILYDMWTQKFRSLLALFGVIWGTLTVILLLALGHGFQQASRKNIMNLADGAFFVIPGKNKC